MQTAQNNLYQNQRFVFFGSTDKDGVTYATLGEGTITVGGETNPELDGLNRDIENAQIVTRDDVNKGYVIDMELDAQTIYNVGWDIPGELWNLPNTVAGGAWGGAGMLYSTVTGLWSDEKSTTHEWDAENRVHIFENNPLGVYETAGTTGNVINFMRNAKDPNSFVNTYEFRENNRLVATDSDMVHFMTHELKHRDQGSYLGIFYLPVYLISGGNSSSNWMEKQADSAGNQMYLQLKGGKK